MDLERIIISYPTCHHIYSSWCNNNNMYKYSYTNTIAPHWGYTEENLRVQSFKAMYNSRMSVIGANYKYVQNLFGQIVSF